MTFNENLSTEFQHTKINKKNFEINIFFFGKEFYFSLPKNNNLVLTVYQSFSKKSVEIS